jgi:uncharacterized protein YutE (UPF0331/DUF86 family)
MAELRDRIRAEIENIDGLLRNLPSAEALPALSALELAGVAALVHSFYNGVENILKQVMVDRGIAIPGGASWHKDLIEECVRQGIMSKGLLEQLRPYLAFRHFFSHAYAFHIDPARTEPLVADLTGIYAKFKAEIERGL